MMSKRDKCSLKLLIMTIIFALIADQSLRYTDIYIFIYICYSYYVSSYISILIMLANVL